MRSIQAYLKKSFLVLLTTCLLLALSASTGSAGNSQIIFGWNQEISVDFAGWRIYKSTSPNVQINASNLMATVSYNGTQQGEYQSEQPLTSPDGQEVTYYFVLTAFDTNGNESSPSNEVSATIDFGAPQSPFTLTVTVQRVQ